MKPPTPKEAYALRADAVYLLRGMGFSLRACAAIFRTTREPIRQLEARGRRAYNRKIDAVLAEAAAKGGAVIAAKCLLVLAVAMPPEAEITHLWDGEARTNIRHVWLARGGFVVTADHGMVCYSDATRPASAPTAAEDLYWKSPAEGTNRQDSGA